IGGGTVAARGARHDAAPRRDAPPPRRARRRHPAVRPPRARPVGRPHQRRLVPPLAPGRLLRRSRAARRDRLGPGRRRAQPPDDARRARSAGRPVHGRGARRGRRRRADRRRHPPLPVRAGGRSVRRPPPRRSPHPAPPLADPRTRLVTLTITGGGYRPGHDRGALRLLVDALERRRHAGLAPFTVLSCDNVPGNGRAAGAAVVGVARERDPALAAWLEEHGAFPSSMVDRITPRTTPADRAFVAERFGIDDRWPVMTEAFSQWVVEDEFSAGRPPLETVGVEL